MHGRAKGLPGQHWAGGHGGIGNIRGSFRNRGSTQLKAESCPNTGRCKTAASKELYPTSGSSVAL